MICEHLSIKAAATGQTDNCLNCKQPIIHDGKRWRWTYDLDAHKRAKLSQIFAIDAITGKHT